MYQEEQHDYYQLFDIAGMPSSMHYFIVYPYKAKQTNQNIRSQLPVLITYYDDETKMFDLIQQFKKKVPMYTNVTNINFQLKMGGCFERFKTMKHIKKDMRRTNIDGLIFYIVIIDQNNHQIHTTFQPSQLSEYDDQNGTLVQFLQTTNQINLQKINLKFQIILAQQNKPQIYLDQFYKRISYQDDSYQKVVQDICTHINNNYQMNFFVMKDSVKKIVIQKTNQILKFSRKICQSLTLQQNSKLKVYFNGGLPHKLIKKVNPSYRLKIFDVAQGNQRKFVQFYYEDIKYWSFEQFYKKSFHKYAQTSDTRYYIEFVNIVISPNETFQKIQQLFNYTNVLYIGEIISQKIGFYKKIQLSVENIQLLQKTIQEDLQIQNYEEFRKKVNIQSTNNPTIPSQIHQSIFLYSSQCKIRNNKKSLYKSVNTFLREQFCLQLSSIHYTSNEIYKWMYKFVKNLIESLRVLKPVQQITVYRGSDFLPRQKKGQFITFKQFLSTSRIKQQSMKFPKQNNKKKNVNQRVYVMYIIHLKSNNGRDIRRYSQFPQEQQVLLLPFTRFYISKIWTQEQNGLLWNYYQLIETPQLYKPKQIRNKFILWTDDNIKQGQLAYDNYLTKSPKLNDPLIFQQLLSTQALIDFIARYRDILCDQWSDVLFISDMYRVEQYGNHVPNAGILGLKQIITIPKFRSPHFVFYIGRKKEAQEEIKKGKFNKSELTNVLVTDNQKQLVNKINEFFSAPIEPLDKNPENGICQIF